MIWILQIPLPVGGSEFQFANFLMEGIMNGSERRLGPRKDVSIPLRFRVSTSNAAAVNPGRALNVSEHGLYFCSDHKLVVGSPVEIFLTLPREITGKGPEEVRCSGRVVRVIEDAHLQGQSGIGVQVDHFEYAASARWAS
jgi:hypothetical protein